MIFDQSDKFHSYIHDLGISIKHPQKDHVTLDDVFIYPDLEHINSNDVINYKHISSENILEKYSYCYLIGSDKSGKTALLKKYCHDLIKQGYQVVTLKSSDIKHYSADQIIKICSNKYNIEYGDTLDEPLNQKDGKLIQFDRVIANPPFSQNYNKATMQYQSRFSFGFAPETGKKGDLMFVQHMLASCKRSGKVVVVMPHGVLFRGGKEKEIRENMLNADILEGLISLPPQLFYGTGIPACIMVFNKSKPDELKNKVFIINADKDYAEGKKQNTLRPEDVEKIDYVFTNKIEEASYSKLVDLDTIASNDYTLNIRRYVDNTPPPEPEDVKAHLIGGVPISEIEKIQLELAPKFDFDGYQLFKDKGVSQKKPFNKSNYKRYKEESYPDIVKSHLFRK